MELAYGTGHHLTDRTVDSHIRGIRKKLGEEGDRIETVYGWAIALKASSEHPHLFLFAIASALVIPIVAMGFAPIRGESAENNGAPAHRPEHRRR